MKSSKKEGKRGLLQLGSQKVLCTDMDSFLSLSLSASRTNSDIYIFCLKRKV